MELSTRRKLLSLGVALALPASPTPARTPAPALAPAPAPQEAAAPAVPRGVATITPGDMYSRIAYLASDALRGRATPSPGLDAAAAYLVDQYRRLGLEPAGERGSYYQWYPLPAETGAAARRRERVVAPNVVAVLRGSDPVLRDEYVVLSAHMDHVGVGAPVNGDSIYNGADDDASGTAALVEVAEALASLPTPPRRSIVFLHVSGEEKGLLGSRWYSDHPTVPLAQLVANVNVDMIGRNAPDTVVVIGKSYSTLGRVVNAVRERHPELGLVAADDPWPQEGFFFRSDHFSFARKEIPAIFFFSGVHSDYHRPSDEVEKIDADKAARVARYVFHTVVDVANAAERPRWDPRGLEEVRRLSR